MRGKKTIKRRADFFIKINLEVTLMVYGKDFFQLSVC